LTDEGEGAQNIVVAEVECKESKENSAKSCNVFCAPQLSLFRKEGNLESSNDVCFSCALKPSVSSFGKHLSYESCICTSRFFASSGNVRFLWGFKDLNTKLRKNIPL
jgi:hypothetical protein